MVIGEYCIKVNLSERKDKFCCKVSSKETKVFIYNVILYICVCRKSVYYRRHFESCGNKFIAGGNYYILYFFFKMYLPHPLVIS